MLNVNTPRGQVALAHEQDLITAIERDFEFSVMQTPKWEAAEVDGFLCRNGEICAVLENKCRDMTLAQLRSRRDEWLVSHDKLVKGAALAKALKVPFYGFLYLIPDGLALSIRIADKDGNLLPNIRLGRTETKANINSSAMVVRTNAYIDMRGAKQVQVR